MTKTSQTSLYFLASACLCGIACRYDGQATPVPLLAKLYEQGHILAVCPEEEGGLATPRPPCERREHAVLTQKGQDVTKAFQAGAEKTLQLAQQHGLTLAVLKERSPSCGSSLIYDGTFSGTRIPGQGLTTALLREHGVRVINEEQALQEIPMLLRSFSGCFCPETP